jgi:hypothetical protein
MRYSAEHKAQAGVSTVRAAIVPHNLPMLFRDLLGSHRQAMGKQRIKPNYRRLFVRDWDFDQGAVPRFLSRFVNLFPDETYNLLLGRIDQASRAREDKQEWLRTFRLVHQNVSFGGVPGDLWRSVPSCSTFWNMEQECGNELGKPCTRLDSQP